MSNRMTMAFFHLILSLMVILGTAGLMVMYFYPGIFADIEDVLDLLEIIIPVDIIIGPLLTLIIFKPGKKGLKFDLLIIALCQSLALAYGCWTVYHTRPGYLVFSYDAFYVAPPSISQEALLDDHKEHLRVGPLGRPKMVYSKIDLPLAEQMVLMQESMQQGQPLQFNSRFFQPLETIDAAVLLKRSFPLEKVLAQATPAEQALLKSLQGQHKRLAYIPIVNDTYIKMIVIDVDSKEPLALLDAFPG